MSRKVFVVDIPAFGRKHHVAGIDTVNYCGTMTFVHTPIADEAGRMVGLQLTAILV